jgi:hypothetical protein
MFHLPTVLRRTHKQKFVIKKIAQKLQKHEHKGIM